MYSIARPHKLYEAIGKGANSNETFTFTTSLQRSGVSAGVLSTGRVEQRPNLLPRSLQPPAITSNRPTGGATSCQINTCHAAPSLVARVALSSMMPEAHRVQCRGGIRPLETPANYLRNHDNQQQQQQVTPNALPHLASCELDIRPHVHTQHAILIGRLALAQRDVSVASAAAAIFDRYTRELAAMEAGQDELMRRCAASLAITSSSSSSSSSVEAQTLLACYKMFDRRKLELVERTANEWAFVSPRATPTLMMTSPQSSSSSSGDVTPEVVGFEMTSTNANANFNDVFKCELGEKKKRKRKRGSLNPKALLLMDNWFKMNTDHPYPDDDVVDDLALQGEINAHQVRKWMANRRVRQRQKLASGCGNTWVKVTAAGDSQTD